MKKLFKKPRWLKPEINEPIYHLHLVILIVTALIVLKYIFNPFLNFNFIDELFSFKGMMVLYIPILIGDIIAHTTLKLD